MENRTKPYGSIDGCRLALDNILSRSLDGDTRLQEYFAPSQVLEYRDSSYSTDRNCLFIMRRTLKITRCFIYTVIKIATDKQRESCNGVKYYGVLFHQENRSIKSEIIIMFLCFMFLSTISVVLSGESLIKGDSKNVRKLSFLKF